MAGPPTFLFQIDQFVARESLKWHHFELERANAPFPPRRVTSGPAATLRHRNRTNPLLRAVVATG